MLMLPSQLKAAVPDRGIDRLGLLAAFVIILGWAAIYTRWAHGPLADEEGHFDAVRHIAEGRPGWPSLPHPPGYHLLVASVAGEHPRIAVARWVTTAFAVMALGAFCAIRKRLHGESPGPAMLLLALLPIFQPFTAMAYTDVAGLALLLCAWWAQLSRRAFVAAWFIGLACLVRQTNLLWAAFFVAWEVLRATGERDHGSRDRPTFGRVLIALRAHALWHLLLIALSVLVVVYLGRLMPATDHGIAVKPNIATLHFAALLALVLGLPVWLLHGKAAICALWQTARTRPQRAIFWGAALLLIVAVFALTFENHNLFNQVLWGRSGTLRYTFLRNWPLVAIDAHAGLRVFSGLAIVVAGFALWLAFRSQRYAGSLGVVVLFGAVLLGSNFLVEPRYFLPPTVMLLTLLEFDRRTLAWLIAWFAILDVIHAPFVINGYSIW